MVDISTSSDQEQIDATKKWIKENALSAFLGLAIGLGCVYGWRYYKEDQESSRVEASFKFEEVKSANLEKVMSFIKLNPGTIYSTNLAFKKSSELANLGQYDEARELLKKVMLEASNDVHQIIARINIAKIYLLEKNPKKAIELLKANVDFKTLVAYKNLVLGDALFADNNADAKQYYKDAITGLSGYPSLASSTQLKIDNLP